MWYINYERCMVEFNAFCLLCTKLVAAYSFRNGENSAKLVKTCSWPSPYSQGEFRDDVEMSYIVEFMIFLVNICLGGPISAGCQNFYPVAFFWRHPMDICSFFLHFHCLWAPNIGLNSCYIPLPSLKKKPPDKKFGTRRKSTPSDP